MRLGPEDPYGVGRRAQDAINRALPRHERCGQSSDRRRASADRSSEAARSRSGTGSGPPRRTPPPRVHARAGTARWRPGHHLTAGKPRLWSVQLAGRATADRRSCGYGRGAQDLYSVCLRPGGRGCRRSAAELARANDADWVRWRLLAAEEEAERVAGGVENDTDALGVTVRRLRRRFGRWSCSRMPVFSKSRPPTGGG